MIRSLIVLAIGLVLTPTSPAVAGLLGASNFDECILENMKGVTNDTAAKLIARACAKMFPNTVPPDFDAQFGYRGSLTGHVYEKSGLDKVLRMEGARVRLLDLAVTQSLKQHLAIRKKMYDVAIELKVVATREEKLATIPVGRKRYQIEVKSLEDALDGLKKNRGQLLVEGKVLSEQAEVAAAAETTKRTEQETAEKAAAEKDAERLKELRSEAKRVADELAKKKTEFVAAQEEADRDFEVQKAKLKAKLAVREKTESAMRTEFEIGRKTAEKKADKRITTAKRKADDLKATLAKANADLDAARRSKAATLRQVYVRNKVVLKSFYGQKYAGLDDVVPCFNLTNKGALAIREVVIGVKFKGRKTSDIGFDVNLIMGLSSMGVAVDSNSRTFYKPMVPKLKNKYDEDVQGIGPSLSWPKRGCASLFDFNVKGDVQRALEKVGGYRSDGWTFYIERIDLAAKDSLHAKTERYSSNKTWLYKSQSTLDLFRKQVDAATPKMEPAKRKKRLTAELAKAEATISVAKVRKMSELAKYDQDNRPLLDQLARQRKAAAEALSQLKHPVVSDAITIDLGAWAMVIKEETAALEKAAEERLAASEAAAAEAGRSAEDWNWRIHTNKAKLQTTDIQISNQEKALAKARGNLQSFEDQAVSLEKRQGKNYEQFVAVVRKEVIKHGAEGDPAWLEALEILFNSAKGYDTRVDLNGAYKFNNIPTGRYLVYAKHVYRRTPVMWLQAVEVGKETNLEMGNFNSIVEPAQKVTEVVSAVASAIRAAP